MNARSILIISLGLNLVLATWVGSKLRRAPSSAAAPPSAAPMARSLPVWSLKKTNVIEVSTNRVDAPKFRWASLETNDFEAYVANLRAIDCPEPTVRHLVMGEIEALYAERIADAEKPGSFWETPRQQRAREARIRKQQQDLENEKRGVLQRLFHVDWTLKAEREFVDDSTICMIIGFLPDEKAIHLVDTATRLEKVTTAFKEDTDRIVIDSDEPRLDALLIEAKRQLEFGLSPWEIQEAILRGVSLAQSFMERDGLAGVTLTGDELRRITAIASRDKDFIIEGLRADLDENRHDHEDLEDMVKKISPEGELEIRALLGDARYADFARSKDESFREFVGIARGLEVPIESTVKAYEIRRATEAAVRQLNANEELATDQKRAALEAMRQETEQAMTAALGATAAKEFFRQDRGWARNTFGSRAPKR